jgi:hypothetical protein
MICPYLKRFEDLQGEENEKNVFHHRGDNTCHARLHSMA